VRLCDSHGSNYEDYCILGYAAMYTGRYHHKMLFNPVLPLKKDFKFCDDGTSPLTIIRNRWALSIIVEYGKMNDVMQHMSIVVSLML
jgi:hypothetical protein